MVLLNESFRLHQQNNEPAQAKQNKIFNLMTQMDSLINSVDLKKMSKHDIEDPDVPKMVNIVFPLSSRQKRNLIFKS